LTKAIRSYFDSAWNRLDFIQLVVIGVIVLMRLWCAKLDWKSMVDMMGMSDPMCEMWAVSSSFQPDCESCHQLQMIARALYAIVTVTVWLRLFDYFRASRSVGKMIIIFGRMLHKDVSTFVALVVIVSPGCGIAFAALQPQVVPRPFTFGAYLYELDSPIWAPFWGLLGDHDLGTMLEATEAARVAHFVLPLLLLCYLLITTVVLVNLLIAQMSETYTSFLANADEEWAYQRAGLILEFKDDYRATWPPPLNLFSMTYHGVVRVLKHLGRLSGVVKRTTSAHDLPRHGFKLYASIEYQATIQRLEQAALQLCIANQDAAEAGKAENVLKHLQDEVRAIGVGMSERLDTRLERLDARIQRLQEAQQNGHAHGASPANVRATAQTTQPGTPSPRIIKGLPPLDPPRQ